MKSKTTKRTFFAFLPYECAAAEEYLELMVEKGWLLESVKGDFFKFIKTDQKNIKYSVDVLHKISIFDRKDSDIALEYREYCKAAGWNYICQIGKTQIFYSQKYIEAISIHTDEEEKFKSVLKASLISASGQFFLTLMFIFNLYIQLFMGDAGFVLASNLGIFAIVSMSTVILINGVGFIRFCSWIIKARRQLKRDKTMNYSNYKQIRIKNVLIKNYVLIMLIILVKLLVFDNIYDRGFNIYFLLIFCIPIIIMIYVKKFIDKKRYSKNINRGITIAGILVSTYLVIMLGVGPIILSSPKNSPNEFPNDNARLVFTDFGFKESNDASPYSTFDKSIIAQRVDYASGNEDEGLYYTIFESDSALVIKFYEKRLLGKLNNYGVDLKRIGTKLPSSIVVYSDSDKKSFVLVAEDKIIDIKKDFSGISDDKFLNIVYEKLLY